MSDMRRVGAIALVTVFVLCGVAGCSGSNQAAPPTTRPSLVFGAGVPPVNNLGVCSVYPVPQMKALIGGGANFRIQPPQAIGNKGDPVVGESCSWSQSGGGNTGLILVLETRKWNDAAGLQTQFTSLHSTTIGATDVIGLGDAAFTSQSPATSLLQMRSGLYMLTYSSTVQGNLTPISLATLEGLARMALPKLR